MEQVGPALPSLWQILTYTRKTHLDRSEPVDKLKQKKGPCLFFFEDVFPCFFFSIMHSAKGALASQPPLGSFHIFTCSFCLGCVSLLVIVTCPNLGVGGGRKRYFVQNNKVCKQSVQRQFRPYLLTCDDLGPDTMGNGVWYVHHTRYLN